jgi:uncharacterized C2H2 Zn-finger protein
MIGSHCGVSLVRLSDNPAYFRKVCPSCGVVFKQRKRKGVRHEEVRRSSSRSSPQESRT